MTLSTGKQQRHTIKSFTINHVVALHITCGISNQSYPIGLAILLPMVAEVITWQKYSTDSTVKPKVVKLFFKLSSAEHEL